MADRNTAQAWDRQHRTYTQDIGFFVDIAREFVPPGGRALEIGYATLRIVLPVAEAGIAVTGVDLSTHMEELARRKLATVPPDVAARVSLVMHDVRDMRLDERYDLIYAPQNMLGLFLTAADQVALFETVRYHLKPGGVFVFDNMIEDVIERPKVKNVWYKTLDETEPDGTRNVRDAAYEYNVMTQTLKVSYRRRTYADNVLREERLSDFEFAMVFPREIEHLIARNRFEVLHRWADYGRRPFDGVSKSQFVIYVTRPGE